MVLVALCVPLDSQDCWAAGILFHRYLGPESQQLIRSNAGVKVKQVVTGDLDDEEGETDGEDDGDAETDVVATSATGSCKKTIDITCIAISAQNTDKYGSV
ncbi:hypothetical protein IW261DRAFT_1422006 [Armillaria novae-zelandiae]|uniref:Uncharacterized protein n=1 Tax=Armillaria novae-zelandiae TaxID=153914 RepID=A0AA39P1A5_9AGAR|nr:hypothetical protein IW261DRAFT_1422006 [Armillaria novae-zelandiae]